MLLQQIKGCIWLYRCDWCQKEFEAPISKSRSKTQGCSRSCGSKAARVTVKANLLASRGVENVSQLPEVREKVKRTSIERFGVECSWQSEDIKKRIKDVMIERYGADSPWNVPEIRSKIEANNFKKYGVRHVWENKEIREKSKQTMLEIYGVDNPQKSAEIRQRSEQTCLERYGVRNPHLSPEILERTKKTCLKRYGSENPFGSEICREKARQTSRKNWGTDYPMQSPEVQCRAVKTFLQKGKGFVSRAEMSCLSILKELYVNVDHQVCVNGWLIDFYVKDIDTYVQFDGVYWHGLTRSREQLDYPVTQRDHDISRKWKRDHEQNVWFVSNQKRLIRITDVQFRSWGDMIKENLRSVFNHDSL